MRSGTLPRPNADTSNSVNQPFIHRHLPRLRHFWPILFLSLLVGMAYWPGRGGGYVFDDFPNIVDNTLLHVNTLDWHAWIAALFSSDAGTLHRPLAMLTFAINHYFTGLDPVPMKLTGIAIHALNACLALALVRTLLGVAIPGIPEKRREWTSRFVAAAWALHPINLMAVLFVVQRMESMAHTFVFAGLWLYLLGRQRQLGGRPGWPLILGGIAGGTVLGALCKESAMLLPLYACIVEVCVPSLRTKAAPRGLRIMFAFLLGIPACIGSAWLLQRYLPTGAYGNRDFTSGERLLTEGRVVLDYVRWTLFPSLRELSLYHDDYPISHSLFSPVSTALSLLGLSLVAMAAWTTRQRRPLVTLGITWFFAAHLLTATIIPLELVFEHRNYFASLGICLAIADLLLLAPKSETLRRVGTLLATLWLVGLALTTNLRAREWSDPYRFAATELAKHPGSPRATYAHARLLAMATEYKADSPLLHQAMDALEQARAVPRSSILPHSALLILAANTGLPIRDAWWSDMQWRLANNPVGVQDASAIAALVSCVRHGRCQFPRKRMLATLQSALGAGKNAEVMNIYADYVLNVMHQPEAAIYLWRSAIRLAPKTAQYRINLIKLLIALGRENEARTEIALLRQTGRFGQNDASSAAMEQRLSDARRKVEARPAAKQDPGPSGMMAERTLR